MSYHQAPSPPYQYEAYSPVSPTAVSHDQQRHQTHTPKRRRLGSESSPEFDPAAQPFIPHDEIFDFSYSPPANFDQRSLPSVPQYVGAFSGNWDMEMRWDDMQSVGTSGEPGDAQHRPNDPVNRSHYTTYLSDPSRAYRQPMDFYDWGMPRMPGPPPTLLPYVRPPPGQNPQPQDQSRPQIPHLLPPHGSIMPLQRLPSVPYQSSPPIPVPSGSIRRKGAITLTLSRASEASIEELPEHKRECPACQLDFEKDNYLAVISCCGTAMHAVCFSAWVNSQTYSKTKVCMKCRKAIDARRPLNNVVPPVTDKSWDEGVEFDAPPHVGPDTKTELDVSGRMDVMSRRYAHMRRDPSYYRRRAPMLNENDITPDFRAAFQEMQRDIRKETDELRARYRNARQDWRSAFEAEARAAQIVVEAKDSLQAGTGMTQREVHGLTERLREAKEAQEHRHGVYRAVSKQLDEQDRRHQARQLAFLESTMRRQQ